MEIFEQIAASLLLYVGIFYFSHLNTVFYSGDKRTVPLSLEIPFFRAKLFESRPTSFIRWVVSLQNNDFQVDSEWKLETIIGNINTTNKCDVTVLRLSRNI